MDRNEECVCCDSPAEIWNDGDGFCIGCAEEAVAEAEDEIGDTVRWIETMKRLLINAKV